MDSRVSRESTFKNKEVLTTYVKVRFIKTHSIIRLSDDHGVLRGHRGRVRKHNHCAQAPQHRYQAAHDESLRNKHKISIYRSSKSKSKSIRSNVKSDRCWQPETIGKNNKNLKSSNN